MREVGLAEINEAFAAQVLAVLRIFDKPSLAQEHGFDVPELGPIDPEVLNPNGGALALGHPVGASGTRLALTLARELHDANTTFALAALCVGGGQGGALLLEKA